MLFSASIKGTRILVEISNGNVTRYENGRFQLGYMTSEEAIDYLNNLSDKGYNVKQINE